MVVPSTGHGFCAQNLQRSAKRTRNNHVYNYAGFLVPRDLTREYLCVRSLIVPDRPVSFIFALELEIYIERMKSERINPPSQPLFLDMYSSRS